MLDIYDILGILFLVVAYVILLGGGRRLKSPSELTIPEFKRNQSRAVAILCPAIGLLIIGKNLYDWRAQGSADLMIYHSLILGSGAILYGIYRAWRLSKGK